MPDEPSIFSGNLPAHVQEALRACGGRALFTHRRAYFASRPPIIEVVAVPNPTLRVRVEGGPVLWESGNA